ncbi:hypothetical protein ElyMa_004971900 [Elysia marginata]|uniref:Apple domain-containing protein n=1 Tax=Elysia marginata TaxID=1093978 RepID=A0AAV4J8Z3_9GAST|nr:hypothetical protein ElyMa_004971900 [Elysia marginata]
MMLVMATCSYNDSNHDDNGYGSPNEESQFTRISATIPITISKKINKYLTLLVCAARCGHEDQCNMFELSYANQTCSLFSERIFDTGVNKEPATDQDVGFRTNFCQC